MLTEKSGDAPGYLTGTTHDPPSTATRVGPRWCRGLTAAAERTPLADIGLKPSQGHICLTARW